MCRCGITVMEGLKIRGFFFYNGEFIINDSKFSLDVTSPMMQLLAFILFIHLNSFSAYPIYVN
jgi:hypothetical protein